jgi:putative ABC transport system permease protein
MSAFSELILVNLKRHKIRAFISIAGVAFGVAAMLMIVSIVLGAIGMFQGILAKESHFVVFEKNVSDLFFSSVSMEQIQSVRALPEVERVDPMLVGIVSSPEHPIVTCFGVEAVNPRVADAIWLSGDKERFGQEPETVYLGERAAEFLKVHLADSVAIGKAQFKVGGIIRTQNGFEDGGVFMPLVLAQNYFHRENLASVASVKLKRTQDSGAFKKAVESSFATLVALQNEEFNQSYSQFRILNFTSWAVGVCSLLLGGMGVANTMLMSIFSRIREMAILRVCGFSRAQIVGLVFGEAGVLAALGAVAGFGIGVAGLALMNRIPQLQGYVHAQVRPEVVGAILLTAFITALLGALYPALFASRIQPADALRFE